MSKARLVITAVVVEGRSQSEVARAYGVSQPWISRLVARWRAEGDAAFEPRSRRPRSSPSATNPEVQELVLRLRKQLAEQGLDAGPHTLCWHLSEHHQLTVSACRCWSAFVCSSATRSLARRRASCVGRANMTVLRWWLEGSVDPPITRQHRRRVSPNPEI
jgi:transposase